VTAELLPNQGVMPVEQRLPLRIPELGGTPGRVDDVGEENGDEHALRLRRLLQTAYELLCLAEDELVRVRPGVAVNQPRDVLPDGPADPARNVLSHPG